MDRNEWTALILKVGLEKLQELNDMGCRRTF